MSLRLSRSLGLAAALVSLSLASCSSEGGGHGESSHGSSGHGSSGHGSKSSHQSSSAGHGKKSSGHGSSHGSSHGNSSQASTAKKSSSSHATAADAAELLELLEVGGSQDPSRFSEVEIGTFRVTHKLTDEKTSLVVKFRLVGIVAESKEERLHEELPKYEKRIRDAVISLVQRIEAEQLAEPELKWLKAELVAAINRVVQDRALSGVAFSDFSLEAI